MQIASSREELMRFTLKDSDVDGAARFFTAVRTGKAVTVQAILRAGVQVDMLIPSRLKMQFGEEQKTALMIAAEMGHQHVAKLLLKHNADPNIANSLNQTALDYAVQKNQLSVVELLLQAGADPNHPKRKKHFLLLDAVSPGVDWRIVKLLIIHGAEVNAKATAGLTALHVVACNGNTKVARLLLDEGADVNAMHVHYRGPLACAIQHHQAEMVDFLLERGADPAKQPEALGLAAWQGMLETVRTLLASGFDPNSRAWKGSTPLKHARYRKHYTVADELQAAGAKG